MEKIPYRAESLETSPQILLRTARRQAPDENLAGIAHDGRPAAAASPATTTARVKAATTTARSAPTAASSAISTIPVTLDEE